MAGPCAAAIVGRQCSSFYHNTTTRTLSSWSHDLQHLRQSCIKFSPEVRFFRDRNCRLEVTSLVSQAAAGRVHLFNWSPVSLHSQARRNGLCVKAASSQEVSTSNTERLPGGEAEELAAPEVTAGDSALTKQLLGQLPRLQEPYKAARGMGNRHLETIFAAFFRTRPNIRFRRECLRMPDGGTVALDWPVGGDDVELWQRPVPQDAPFLILLPGLTGGSDDTYIRHMLLRARRAGWGVVVFNSRGCADSPVTSPQFYSASYTEDLRQVVRHVATRQPLARLYAAGWSLGANILVRYLGQEGEDTPLSGAVSLCNPFDLVLADRNFHVGFNNVYDKSLSRALNKIFKKHAPLFEEIGGEFDIPLVARAKSVRDFDQGLTRVSFGYKTVDDYYRDASSAKSVPHVRIPLLCVQAKDDPIAPADGIPYNAIKENSNCILVVTPYGGHLGWVAGEEAPFGAPWTDPLVMEYLVALNGAVGDKPASERMHGQTSELSVSSVESHGEGAGDEEDRLAHTI
eukprot:jgi/Mesen1/4006/ME000211S03190